MGVLCEQYDLKQARFQREDFLFSEFRFSKIAYSNASQPLSCLSGHHGGSEIWTIREILKAELRKYKILALRARLFAVVLLTKHTHRFLKKIVTARKVRFWYGAVTTFEKYMNFQNNRYVTSIWDLGHHAGSASSDSYQRPDWIP